MRPPRPGDEAAKKSAIRRPPWVFYVGAMGIITLAAGIVGACSSGVGPDGPLVGSACEEQLDCADGSACILDQVDFPGGMCAKVCQTQADCPEMTACVDVHGGHCLLSCTGGSECRAGIGCRAKRNRADSLDSDVCINDDN